MRIVFHLSFVKSVINKDGKQDVITKPQSKVNQASDSVNNSNSVEKTMELVHIKSVDNIIELSQYLNDTQIKLQAELRSTDWFNRQIKSKGRFKRLLNGENAQLNDIPSFSQIINRTSLSFCGAVAISRHCVLTCAHCFKSNDAEDIEVRIGGIRIFRGNIFNVKKIIKHYTDDIALVFTKEEIFEEYIIKLSKRRERKDEKLTFYGYGITSFENGRPILPIILQKTNITILPFTVQEKEALFATTGTMMRGDSGAPLVWREFGGEVVGGLYKAEASIQDGRLELHLFMRVSTYKSWIEKTIYKEINLILLFLRFKKNIERRTVILY
ncbi:Peptidase S1 domain-containing protein [Meloidogyne graminicola]|uniref:Peptidase S1 domain-containing protein n=1 Tax=Meloidogyne graminicola TaxID=189291 RepID=A0A8S9ZRD5_9BILA|nr:Peptidase S1 domain-containing protein [Meloidogyne graminicola]